MKKVFVSIVLAGCGVSSTPPDGIEPPQAPPHTRTSATSDRMPPGPLTGYRIEALPTPVPSGRSYASRAICATGGVVGTSDITGFGESHAVRYAGGTLTDLGTLGGATSSAIDGNAAGTIVGNSAAPNNGAAFVYRNGVMSQLSGIGGQFSSAYAINDREEIVGQASIPGEGDVDEHAILWEPDCSNAVDLTALNGGRYSWARDINNSGDIVGSDAILPDMIHSRAVAWRNRVLVELDDNGAPDSQATAINESGAITGFIQGLGGRRAVIWRNGTMVDLGSLGGQYSDAMGIDNAGDVVGDSTLPAGYRFSATLFTAGTVIDLNDYIDQTHWWLAQATDICDDGRIVGNGELDGVTRGFILTPEP